MVLLTLDQYSLYSYPLDVSFPVPGKRLSHYRWKMGQALHSSAIKSHNDIRLDPISSLLPVKYTQDKNFIHRSSLQRRLLVSSELEPINAALLHLFLA